MQSNRFRLPSAIQGQPYFVLLDGFGFLNVRKVMIQAGTPLRWIPETRSLSGVFDSDGVFDFEIDVELDSKDKQFVLFQVEVLPEPKTLWNSVQPPADAPFPVEHEVFHSSRNESGRVIACSTRGRSHAHVGRFREDAFGCFVPSGSNMVVMALSDGAGSAQFSRIGANAACNGVLRFATLLAPGSNPEEFVREAFFHAIKEIRISAGLHDLAIREMACTLSVLAIEKQEQEYRMWAAGVGDCLVAYLSKEHMPTLLFQPEEGMFAGETNFLTDESINVNKLRVSYLCVPVHDFGFIFAMTDGVSDPWFESMNGLRDNKKWMEFVNSLPRNDLTGVKDDNADRMLEWLQFWSPGNHDDRTLIMFTP